MNLLSFQNEIFKKQLQTDDSTNYFGLLSNCFYRVKLVTFDRLLLFFKASSPSLLIELDSALISSQFTQEVFYLIQPPLYLQ